MSLASISLKKLFALHLPCKVCLSSLFPSFSPPHLCHPLREGFLPISDLSLPSLHLEPFPLVLSLQFLRKIGNLADSELFSKSLCEISLVWLFPGKQRNSMFLDILPRDYHHEECQIQTTQSDRRQKSQILFLDELPIPCPSSTAKSQFGFPAGKPHHEQSHSVRTKRVRTMFCHLSLHLQVTLRRCQVLPGGTSRSPRASPGP